MILERVELDSARNRSGNTFPLFLFWIILHLLMNTVAPPPKTLTLNVSLLSLISSKCFLCTSLD